MTHACDIIVVGAGLVGLSAAVAFSQLGKSVVLVDAKKDEIKKTNTWDSRIYALTPATENWLRALGVWQHVDTARVNEIHAMHLWSDSSKSPLSLADSDANIEKLGVIVESVNLMQALQATNIQINGHAAYGMVVKYATCKSIENTAQAICLTLDDGAQISAKLLVAADGANSFVRKQMNIATKSKPLHQTAIVANFSSEKSHQNIAHQWFGVHETMALLPLVGKNVSLVWSLSTEMAHQLLLLDKAALAARVGEKSKQMLGDLRLEGEVLSFALNQATATQLIAERVVMIGDAAHQIHPMAGQGVNLGFRDVIAVQDLLAKTHAMQDIGEYVFLREYERGRKADIMRINGLTSGLDALFASEYEILKKLTNFGMRTLNKRDSIKKVLIKQAVA